MSDASRFSQEEALDFVDCVIETLKQHNETEMIVRVQYFIIKAINTIN